ncbi:FYVE and coiled-coil domain-containing protein 1 isoform X1 [Oryzias melastigma]|uniref:FYVE and coiled-coil domain-containing protein 1 n=2 Tax=Oryzias melastigma TaxID=30732 RepID=A0A3B3BK67_ORYME|nr:FYVE and coiled-coil domain-containing protein 1 isoform X1 [Oryzias melastigma]XP_024134160.1 FYVE and coiled-coil domain-containing protein 1 isoform X1 [Oryzias melastigma]XP_024134161.1 FYVE and coiled-coil domain-containing protein 1 isoform X1 [Oryzias melastigma]XP_024134162.1 FYVE and coiled-coil domain-containing protein 1 isoform X1 [Oryzias melastigma]XP_024134163.1 FYVE and coiled-coil domain-containing protein 1 isoform X1 [Oryzias melastigma]
MAAAGESQLQRIIRDLYEAVEELSEEYKESEEPITDDSTNLHKFSYRLEYLLQFDQKIKSTFLGTKKDYWDYFNDCLAKVKGANDGIRFVKSISELKTSLGKGRAFIRYSLVHQRLADTLQQCLTNQRVTSDWYNARSPFLKPDLNADIVNHLYDLNQVKFDVAPRGHDLDASWPTFARRTLGSLNSPGHTWRPPSRSSSINSLASSYSQQASEFLSSFDHGQSLLNDLNESLPACMEDVGTVDSLRLELDQSELKQRELMEKVLQLGEEAAELRGVTEELQRQLDVSLSAQEEYQEKLKAAKETNDALAREVQELKTQGKASEARSAFLQEKLTAAEGKNVELMAKVDGILNEKGLQAAVHFDSAQKIHELLDRLKDAEEGKMEAVSELEEKKLQTKKMEEDFRVREEEVKLQTFTKARAEFEEKMKEQCDQFQRELTMKEEEAGNLQRELQGEKRKAREDVEVLQKNMRDLKESLEAEVAALQEKLQRKEAELHSSSETLQQLEARQLELTSEKEKLITTVAECKEKIQEETSKNEKYKLERDSLLESEEKLRKEMTASLRALEAELAALRASEKQLRGQLEDTKMTEDEKERRLREDNRALDESLQRAEMAAKHLEEENETLRREKDAMQAALTRTQEDLRKNREELEERLQKNEATFQEQLQAKQAQVENQEKDFVELQLREKELQVAKANAEATCAKQTEMIERITSENRELEKSRLERDSAHARDNQTVAAQLNVAEKQLEVRMGEVSRLQAEILELKVQVQRSEEEKLKFQAQLEVTEAQRDELRSLTEQLKSQTEAANQQHVAELVEAKRTEKELMEQRDREAAALREQLSSLKAENSRLAVENGEARESLDRANTEMAELGMTVCKLNAEKEEATELWAGSAAATEEMEKEVEELRRCREELQQENNALRGELEKKEKLPGAIEELQEQLEKAKNQVQNIRESCQEEVEAVRFQMSSENMSYQVQMKSVSEQLEKTKVQLQEELSRLESLGSKVSQLEAVNEEFLQLVGEKDAHITKTEASLRESDGEIDQLRNAVSSAEEAHAAAREMCEELKQKLKTTEAERQNQQLKMTAEIEDLNRTKAILEERLIELIRDKDALWQKSDALEFEQKLRAEERWWLVDNEATHCLGCRGQFTWWLRRHHCRLCGRIFCYYCSNYYVKQSGKKERCCKDCYTQDGAVGERSAQAEVSSSDGASSPPVPESEPCRPTPRVTAADSSDRSDDGAFDIITEEEVNGVYDSDAASQTTGGSEGEPERRHQGALETDVTPDEEHVPSVQDSEINLLKSGEVTMTVPLNTEDISQFGDGSRELFIKSSCYSVITVAVSDCGPTISWMFSSEPKSISFSVVYRESWDAQVEQSKVLIPLTRCNSHKETVQGQLKVRAPGLYSLIFDNSFSRFVAKKVFYHLTMEKPVIYDGSDCP